jgi:hypothetical protein
MRVFYRDVRHLPFRILPLLAAGALALFGLACKSTPPPAPPIEEAKTVDGATSAGTLTEARERALTERARALDFESDAYFPSEWEAAEADYSAAAALSVSAQELVGVYSVSADSFRGLFERTLPLFAQAREDEILAARDGAQAGGLAETFPDYLLWADQTALAALDQYEAGDYYAACDSAALALDKYQVLHIAADAWLLRQEIVDRDFAVYDLEHFDMAGETLALAMDAYSAGDMAAARSGVEEATLRFTLALYNGWAAYADLQGSLASAERQAALDVKAHLAVKELFDQSDEIFQQAADSFAGEHYATAARRYIEAAAIFAVAGVSAAEKRREAAAAIRKAGDKLAESGETVRRAELIIEGGSP